MRLKNSASENVFGVNIDRKLSFDCHVNHLCNKANKKLRALARVPPNMTLVKKKIVMNSFFHAQFTAPLFGCFAVVKIIIKSNIYMKDVYD